LRHSPSASLCIGWHGGIGDNGEMEYAVRTEGMDFHLAENDIRV
jgi:hypothetical protein